MTQETALHLMKSGHSLFLTGAPGTGKTYVINKYLEYLSDYGVQAAVTAPTGIAASHIGGQTIHSFFGLGIKNTLDQYDIEALTEKKYLWDKMKDLKILIIDEVSMLSPELFESIDRILRTFKFSGEPFGGVQIILVGDFFQLPPVQSGSSERSFIFQTDLWQELGLKICYLEKSYRHEDEVLLKILDEMRSANISEESMQHFRSRYKKAPKSLGHITKLYTHNRNVDALNEQELAKINEPLKIYQAQTKGPKKWTERIFSSALVLPELRLKKGALVFFIKNNHEKSYINGTLGTVVDFDVFGIPFVETFDGRRIKAEHEEWSALDAEGKQKASVKQIPLRLAWAITIHKSQGMTLDAAEIDLSHAFEPGQGYVALSRIKSIEGLKLMGLGEMALATDERVRVHDEQLKKISCENHEEVCALSEEEQAKQTEAYMKQLGGSIEKGKEEELKEKKSLTKTHLQTKALLENGLGLEEIAKEREVALDTVFKHIQKIIAEDPECDISHLQPKSSIIERVAAAKEEIEAKNQPEDFSEKGEVKLKSIFNTLNEKVSYEDIKKALLFI